MPLRNGIIVVQWGLWLSLWLITVSAETVFVIPSLWHSYRNEQATLAKNAKDVVQQFLTVAIKEKNMLYALNEVSNYFNLHGFMTRNLEGMSSDISQDGIGQWLVETDDRDVVLVNTLELHKKLLEVLFKLSMARDLSVICKIGSIEKAITGKGLLSSLALNLTYTFLLSGLPETGFVPDQSCAESIGFPDEELCYLPAELLRSSLPVHLKNRIVDMDRIAAMNDFFYEHSPSTSLASTLEPLSNVATKLEIFSKEFEVYLILWKAIRELYSYNCENSRLLLGPNYRELELYSIIWPDNQKKSFSRLYTNDRCEFVIVIRGTQSKSEALLDFMNWSVPIRDGTNTFHYGFYLLSERLDLLVSQTLERYGISDCTNPSFIVSGHSLGGAVALQLAHLIEQRYIGAKIKALTFGAPPAISGAHSRSIVYRSVIDYKDPLRTVTCDRGISTLGVPRSLLKHEIPNGSGYDSFLPTPSKIIIKGSRQHTDLSPVDIFWHYINEQHMFRIKDDAFSLYIESLEQAYMNSIEVNGLEHRETDRSPGPGFLARLAQYGLSLFSGMSAYISNKIIPDSILDDMINNKWIVHHDTVMDCTLSSICRSNPKSNFLWNCTI